MNRRVESCRRADERLLSYVGILSELDGKGVYPAYIWSDVDAGGKWLVIDLAQHSKLNGQFLKTGNYSGFGVEEI